MCRELLNLWQLPESLVIDGQQCPVRADYRDVLQVFGCLNDEHLPLFARWRKALRLFYCQPVLPQHRQEAMEQLLRFVTCNREAAPGPRLINWDRDADLIAAEINRVAGCEVRAQKFVHWWTFLGWFDAIGPGPFAQIVALREKLETGKKLSEEDRAFYKLWRDRIRLPEQEQIRDEKAYLEQLLKGGNCGENC